MRIQVISMWPSDDAPERGIFVERQVAALQRLGHEVGVTPLQEIRAGAIRTPLKYISLARRGRWLARQLRPQVVHGHFLLPTGYVTRLVAHRLRLPYVVTAHGTDVRNAEHLVGVRKRTEPVVRDAAAVIAVSQDLADRLRALYPGLSVEVVDMGVDVDRFHPGDARVARSGRSRGAGRLVAVANLLPNKNHVRLIEAVASIPGMRLACVGDGPEREALLQLVQDMEVGDRVSFAGRVPHDELAQWYRNVDAACLVSLDEGFGLSALEALACGCPTVVSATAPVSALIEPGVTGEVVDPGDVADIARGLRAAVALQHASIEAARAVVAGRTTDDRAAELVAVLERVAMPAD